MVANPVTRPVFPQVKMNGSVLKRSIVRILTHSYCYIIFKDFDSEPRGGRQQSHVSDQQQQSHMSDQQQSHSFEQHQHVFDQHQQIRHMSDQQQRHMAEEQQQRHMFNQQQSHMFDEDPHERVVSLKNRPAKDSVMNRLGKKSDSNRGHSNTREHEGPFFKITLNRKIPSLLDLPAAQNSFHPQPVPNLVGFKIYLTS